ncbi:MAG: GDSL-type esterase/lipase family protein [Crocinitomicaceae bacterium]
MISKYVFRFSLLAIICFCNSVKSLGQVNPCLQISSYKIVVLGSSTAAGAGVSNSDSAWVNRYRSYLESINPNNEVVNLAVGGYNTYRIMPTGFTPPASRPNPDINKNISAALAENPDAIIVNMPSNDVAGGFSYAEQMFNLDTIVQIANASNTPIWICTTQPRNFSSSTLLQLQSDLKDSINSIFNPFTIDFWSTITNTNHTINPIYDSGDGVHLNDIGHALLHQRVVDEGILTSLFTPSLQVDYGIQSILVEQGSECGDSNSVVQIVVANQGILDTLSSTLTLNTFNQLTNQNSSNSILFTPIPSCSIDTILLSINLYNSGQYMLTANLQSVNDLNTQNDTAFESVSTLGHPEISHVRDTLCMPGYGSLVLNQAHLDTSFWYETLTDSIPFFNGSSFQSQYLDTTTTWYTETIRGDLFYKSNIETTTNSNITWNGAMFDIISQQNVLLDSIGLKINDIGSQAIDIYYKLGSYIGFENSPNDWTLLTTTTSIVSNNVTLTYYDLSAFSILANDTVGIYVQMSNPQSDLSYQSVSAPISRSNSELTISTGTGISHNFVGNYFPRDLNCDVRYHFGSRPKGACSTGKYPATVFVSNYALNIGNDTIIDLNDSISIQVPNHLNNWYWNLNATDSILTVKGNELGTGIHYIVLSGYDSLACFKTDEMTIGVAKLASTMDLNSSKECLYPNPTKNWIYSDELVQQIEVYSINGELVYTANQFPLSLTQLPPNVYFIKLTTQENKVHYSKIVKE